MSHVITLHQKWAGFDKLIDRWLIQRTQLLVRYNRLCLFHHPQTTQKSRQLKVKALSLFTATLIQYLEDTQYNIRTISILLYQNRANNTQNKQSLSILLQQRTGLHARMQLFSARTQNNSGTLTAAISEVGEDLAMFLDWEDIFITQYIQKKLSL
jgi:regulator of sigma D